MERYFEKGHKLVFNDSKTEYEIKDIIGRGSSCVVYYAIADNGTEHLLKEYNPKLIDVARDFNGNLFTDSEEDEEEFRTGLRRFKDGCEKQISIRRASETRNTTSNIQCTHTGYGTEYIDMSVFSGVTFDKVQINSLYELVRYIISITKVVDNYHNAGYLHLDIKPENIFTIPETPELVMLFDFDSVTKKDSVYSSKTLSYTKNWAAPEQYIPGKSSQICEATDLFAIGEMLFYYIFGRHSEASERRSFSEYVFDGTSPLTEGLEKNAVAILKEIFKHTIQNKVLDRYRSSEELLDALNKLIALVDSDKQRLIDSIPSVQSFFVGRENELCKMKDKLALNKNLFVCGMGGIGKSELVKNYLNINRDNYEHIIYSVCNSSLEQTLNNDNMIAIRNFTRQPDESISDYYSRKLRKLNELLSEKDILIVDNFDRPEDERIKDFLSLPCFCIFTTRFNYEEIKKLTGINASCIFIEAITNSKEIFNYYYRRDLTAEEEKAVDSIIAACNGHTMIIEMLAKQMSFENILPSEISERIKHRGLGNLAETSGFKDLFSLFNIDSYDSAKKYVLANISAIPHSGMSLTDFMSLCNILKPQAINELVSSGWINRNEIEGVISQHPLLAEVSRHIIQENNDICNVFLHNLLTYIIDKTFAQKKIDEKREIVSVGMSLMETLELVGCKTLAYADYICDFCEASSDFLTADYTLKYIKTAHSIKACLTESGIRINMGESYETLAKAYLRSGDISRTEYCLTESLELRKKQDEYPKNDDAVGLFRLFGICLTEKEDYIAAEDYIRQYEFYSKKLYGSRSNRVGDAHYLLGCLYMKKNLLQNAEDHIRQSLFVFRDSPDKTDELLLRIQSLYADIFKEKGKFDQAVKEYKKALQISDRLYGKYCKTSADLCLCINKLLAGFDTSEANDYLSRAAEIYDGLDDKLNAKKCRELLLKSEKKTKKRIRLFKKVK